MEISGHTKIFAVMFFVSYNYTVKGDQATDSLWDNL